MSAIKGNSDDYRSAADPEFKNLIPISSVDRQTTAQRLPFASPRDFRKMNLSGNAL